MRIRLLAREELSLLGVVACEASIIVRTVTWLKRGEGWASEA